MAEWKGDILAVGVTEKDIVKDESSKFQNSILKKLDAHLGGLLAEAFSEEDFTWIAGQLTFLRLLGLGSKRVVLVGLGRCVSTSASYCSLGEAVAGAAKAVQASNVAIALDSSKDLSADSKLNTAKAIVSGICFFCLFLNVKIKVLYIGHCVSRFFGSQILIFTNTNNVI